MTNKENPSTLEDTPTSASTTPPVDQAQIEYEGLWQNARYRRAETLDDLSSILSGIEGELIARHCRPPTRYGSSVMEWCHTWTDEDGRNHTTRPHIMILHNYSLNFEIGDNFKMSGVVIDGADTDKVFDLFVSCLDTLYATRAKSPSCTPGEWRMTFPSDDDAETQKMIEQATNFVVSYHVARESIKEATKIVEDIANAQRSESQNVPSAPVIDDEVEGRCEQALDE